MNKDVRNTISEAFDELYKELIKEDAPVDNTELTAQEQAKADSMLDRARKLGGSWGFSHSGKMNNQGTYDAYNESGKKVFNHVIDTLVDEYQINRDPKIKDALQFAYYPAEGTLMYNYMMNKFPGKSRADIEDGITHAYSKKVVQNFDDFISGIDPGKGNLGSKIMNAVETGAHDWVIRGYRGGSKEGGEAYMDAPIGGDSEKTLKDKLAGQAEETPFDTEAQAADFKKRLDIVNKWLEQHVVRPGESGAGIDFPVPYKQYAAWMALTSGLTPELAMEEYPGVFRNIQEVSIYFKRFQQSKAAKEISDLISHAYNTEWQIADIDPKMLAQQYSMDPAFAGEYSQRKKISGEKVKAAHKRLQDVLKPMGYADADFNSEKKISKIVDSLEDSEMWDEADEVKDAAEALKAAKKEERESGEYDVTIPALPGSEKAEKIMKRSFGLGGSQEKGGEEFGGQFEGFEGFSVDALMERVMKRISE